MRVVNHFRPNVHCSEQTLNLYKLWKETFNKKVFSENLILLSYFRVSTFFEHSLFSCFLFSRGKSDSTKWYTRTRVEIEPRNWSRSGRIALVVTRNRSGYPTRNESSGLKLIPNQYALFRAIPESDSELNRVIPNDSKAHFQFESTRSQFQNNPKFQSEWIRSISDSFGLKVWTDSDWSDSFELRVRIDSKYASDWYELKLASDLFGITRIGSETDFWMGRIGLE